MECGARASSRSWGEASTQRTAVKETNALPEYFENQVPPIG